MEDMTAFNYNCDINYDNELSYYSSSDYSSYVNDKMNNYTYFDLENDIKPIEWTYPPELTISISDSNTSSNDLNVQDAVIDPLDEIFDNEPINATFKIKDNNKSLDELIKNYRPIQIPVFNENLYEKEQILNYIKDYYKKHGKTPIFKKNGNPIKKSDVLKTFGTWTNALIAANVPLNINYSKFIVCAVCGMKMIQRSNIINKKTCSKKCQNYYSNKMQHEGFLDIYQL